MEISPIKFFKSLYYANRPFQAEMPKTRVDLPYELEDDIYNKIAASRNFLENAADRMQTPIRFVQKGEDLVLMNMHPYTSVINKYMTQEEVTAHIKDHVNKSAEKLAIMIPARKVTILAKKIK